MENKINVAELLKDCPKGMELDCTICNNVVTLEGVDTVGYYPIRITSKDGFNHVLTHEGCIYKREDAKCVIFPKGKTTWEGFVPPCMFKDGDVLVHTQNERFIMSIYKSNEIGIIINTHVIFRDREEGLSVGMQICCYTDSTRLATEEEKQRLFQAIKDNGYNWNPETKTLEKLVVKPKFKVGDKVRHKNNHNVVFTISSIEEDSYVCGGKMVFCFNDQDEYELAQNKFDINTLKPFDKVLVRDNNEQFWTCDWFSFHDTKQVYPFACVGHYVSQCIPYEGNEHLLGTTDDCDEYYKNW